MDYACSKMEFNACEYYKSAVKLRIDYFVSGLQCNAILLQMCFIAVQLRFHCSFTADKNVNLKCSQLHLVIFLHGVHCAALFRNKTFMRGLHQVARKFRACMPNADILSVLMSLLHFFHLFIFLFSLCYFSKTNFDN